MKRNHWASTAIILVALIATLCPSMLVAQQGSIEGRVTVGGTTVADADVRILALGRSARVDAAGRFSFDAVPPGDYVVEAESPRWGRGAGAVRVEPERTASVTIVVEAIFHLDEMVVSTGAGAARSSEAYQPASVVTARDLVARGEASLGETLSREPGVSSTYFGPGASRPVIRGIGGDRVRVLTGGIGVGDASSTSPDHAVSLESRTAERIEVVRGPATLLYGSSAVGGVVNVLDGSIARTPPTQAISGYVEGLGGTVADERTGSAGITMHRGPVVVSASGLWRDASDYAIPGFAERDPDPGEDPGVLENSALENRSGVVGVTLTGSAGYLGVAASVQRSDYGVPGHHDEGGSPPPPTEEAPVTIDLDQRRLDVEGMWRFGSGVVRNVKARVGLTDYEHVELEGDEVGTRFNNDFLEARLVSEHEIGERLQGALGAQLSTRDFEAVGDEAFVPPSWTRTVAVFGYEEIAVTDALSLQTGLRLEHQRAEARSAAPNRSDHGLSTSLGLNWQATDMFSLAASGSRSVKLPNAEELFSNGPHAATSAYEIGDPALGSEVALGLDVTAHVHAERFRAGASVFVTDFSDYIYEEATGGTRDGLTEFAFVQSDARFTGFELEGELDVVEGLPSTGRPHVSIEWASDYVRAELTATEQPLPRIPALRFGAGGNFRQGPVAARVFARRTTAQERVGPFEDPTEGFTTLEASLSYRFFTGDLFHDVTLVGTNLTDAEARLHTSFLKDVAPLPGREVRLVYRLNF